MKPVYKTCSSIIAALALVVNFSCMKDKATHTYTIQTPVVKTSTEIRKSIATTAATSIRGTGKIFTLNNYIFLSEKDKGIHIIDNSNPASPRNAAFINIPGNRDMAVRGQYLYADAYGDLVSFDISNPLHATPKNFFSNLFPDRWANGNATTNPDSLLAIVDWITRDTTVDLNANLGQYCATCPYLAGGIYTAAAANTSQSSGTAGSMSAFAIVADRLYTASQNNLNVFDISSGEIPILTNTMQLNWSVETAYPFRDKLFVGSNSGVYMLDLKSDPDHPNSIGQFAHARACDPVVADGNYAYVTLSDGTWCMGNANELDIIDISNINFNSWGYTIAYPMTNPKGLAKDGNSLFVCDGKEGLKVYDVSDIKKVKLTAHIGIGATYDVIANGGLAIVVASDGIYQFDYSKMPIESISRIPINSN